MISKPAPQASPSIVTAISDRSVDRIITYLRRYAVSVGGCIQVKGYDEHLSTTFIQATLPVLVNVEELASQEEYSGHFDSQGALLDSWKHVENGRVRVWRNFDVRLSPRGNKTEVMVAGMDSAIPTALLDTLLPNVGAGQSEKDAPSEAPAAPAEQTESTLLQPACVAWRERLIAAMRKLRERDPGIELTQENMASLLGLSFHRVRELSAEHRKCCGFDWRRDVRYLGLLLQEP